jgi:hypothetical protein
MHIFILFLWASLTEILQFKEIKTDAMQTFRRKSLRQKTQQKLLQELQPLLNTAFSQQWMITEQD